MKIQELSTGKIMDWTIEQILEEINRDRSEGWTPYNKDDWREGWLEWCEGDYYTLLVLD